MLLKLEIPYGACLILCPEDAGHVVEMLGMYGLYKKGPGHTWEKPQYVTSDETPDLRYIAEDAIQLAAPAETLPKAPSDEDDNPF